MSRCLLALGFILGSITTWGAPVENQKQGQYVDGKYVGPSQNPTTDHSNLRLTRHYPGYRLGPEMTPDPNSKSTPPETSQFHQPGYQPLFVNSFNQLFNPGRANNYGQMRDAANNARNEAGNLDKEKEQIKREITELQTRAGTRPQVSGTGPIEDDFLSLSLDEQLDQILREFPNQAPVNSVTHSSEIPQPEVTQSDLGSLTEQTLLESVREQQTEITQLNSGTRGILANPELTTHISPEIQDVIREQLDYSDALAQKAVELAQNGTDRGLVRLVGDFAKDLAVSTDGMVRGFVTGFYHSFENASQVLVALYNNPELITHLSENFMNVVTSRELPTQIISAIRDFWVGSAFDKTHALGSLGGNLAMALATGSAFSSAQGALETIGQRLLAHPSKTLGESIEQGIRSAPALAEKAAKFDNQVAELVKVGNKIGGFEPHTFEVLKRYLSEVKQIRDGYTQELTALKNTEGQLLQAGRTYEEVARHFSQARRDIGLRYKDATPNELKDFLYGRNIERYGDPLGPTIDRVILKAQQKGLQNDELWKHIIKKSTTPNEELNTIIRSLED